MSNGSGDEDIIRTDAIVSRRVPSARGVDPTTESLFNTVAAAKAEPCRGTRETEGENAKVDVHSEKTARQPRASVDPDLSIINMM